VQEDVKYEDLPPDFAKLGSAKLSEKEWTFFKNLDIELKKLSLTDAWNNTEASCERIIELVEEKIKKNGKWTAQGSTALKNDGGIVRKIVFCYDRPPIYLVLPFIEGAPPSIVPSDVISL
jgi:hypothetical protein